MGEEAGSFVVSFFFPVLQIVSLGEVPGEGFNRLFICSKCVSSGSWSLFIGHCQGRGSLIIATGPGVMHLVEFSVLWIWS